MMTASILLLAITLTHATYSVSLFHSNHTTCEDSQFRFGIFTVTACTPAPPTRCTMHTELHIFSSVACYNQLTDFPFASVLVYGWASSNPSCAGDAPSKSIVRTGQCESRARFTHDGVRVTVDVYDDDTCSGAPVASHQYPFGECTTGSHYNGATVRFENNV